MDEYKQLTSGLVSHEDGFYVALSPASDANGFDVEAVQVVREGHYMQALPLQLDSERRHGRLIGWLAIEV